MVYHYLALQNYKLFCKEIAEEHEELTGSGGLLGQNAYSAVAQSLGRPDVGHKEFPIFLPSHHATAEGPLTPSPTISLYAPLLLRNPRAFRMP